MRRSYLGCLVAASALAFSGQAYAQSVPSQLFKPDISPSARDLVERDAPVAQAAACIAHFAAGAYQAKDPAQKEKLERQLSAVAAAYPDLADATKTSKEDAQFVLAFKMIPVTTYSMNLVAPGLPEATAREAEIGDRCRSIAADPAAFIAASKAP